MLSVTDIEETTTWCLSELPDFSQKETYPYTFAQDGHSLTVADTAGVETQGRYYVYRDTLRSIYGCDSVHYTLKAAVVRPVVMPAEVRYRCANDMMAGDDWHIEGWDEHNNKEEYEAMSYPGTYTDIRKSVSGCDSIIYTLQIIEYPAYARYKLSFVDPDPVDYRTKLGTVYIYEGEKYHCGENDYSEKGEYEEKTKTINGCDSVIVFTLEILPNEEHRYDTVCQNMLPYVLTLPDGSTFNYSESGDYEHKTKSQQGNDLLVVLHLTVQKAETAAVEEAFISSDESYTWQGHEGFAGLTEPGLYHDTVYYTTGCDSICYTLDLKVYNPAVKVSVSADSVCADDASFTVRILALEGEPVNADIFFSEKAHTVGLRDTLGINVAGTGETVCCLPMPAMPDDAYLRPDDYGFAVRITDIFGNITDHPASLAVLYPAWVVMQRWNDVLMVQNERYNGHYIFSAIRWFLPAWQFGHIQALLGGTHPC